MTKVGRNDLCPCGSGKKFKRCCLVRIEEEARLERLPVPRPDSPVHALYRPESDAILSNASPWVTLESLLGTKMSAQTLLRHISLINRDGTLFTLARIAADLANAPGGVFGDEARAWTHELLVQRLESDKPLERMVSSAVARLPKKTAIAHAHVVFFLQVLALAHGSAEGPPPSDAFIAFLMLAASDHIPEWPTTRSLSSMESVLGTTSLCSIFNRSDDPMRSIVRLVEILGRAPSGSLSQSWDAIQEHAFGTSFQQYAELFLIPLSLYAKKWRGNDPPVLFPAAWRGRRPDLYERWFDEASLTIDQAAQTSTSRPLPSGLLGLPAEFFRKPFVRKGETLLALSPWHMRDYATLGTYFKLSEATKKVLRTDSIQAFSAAFGYSFERWCREVAVEAARGEGFKDTLILPSEPGSHDEIEDIVLADGSLVALISAKGSLVPETSVKTAQSATDVVGWLTRFFFEDPATARAKGHRGGALYLLDEKIQRLRAGEYEPRLHRDVTILPGVACFDFVGGGGMLYKWLEDECQRRSIVSARRGVRPITILDPEDFEGLMAVGARGSHSICALLEEKTQPSPKHKFGALDWFLFSKVADSVELRLPFMKKRFSEIVDGSLARLKEFGVGEPSPPT